MKTKNQTKITKAEFESRFAGVVAPVSRNAPHPEFNPQGINESRFEDECRGKRWRILFLEKGQSVDVDWISEGRCDAHHEFDKELVRCFRAVGVKSNIHVTLRDREMRREFEYDLQIES